MRPFSNIGAVKAEAGYVTLKTLRLLMQWIEDLDSRVSRYIVNGKIVADHTDLLNKGTNTHGQIDSHISNASLHFLASTLIDRGTSRPTASATAPFFYLLDQQATNEGDIIYIKGQRGNGTWDWSRVFKFPDT